MTSDDPKILAEQNEALVRRYLAAINAWDFATLNEMRHPDITVRLPWTIEPFPKVVQGRENAMKFSESVPDFATAENLYDIEVYAFAKDPNELYLEFKSDMELKSGREYKNDYLARVTIKDGKVFEFREYPDPLRLLVALGGSINPPTDRPNIDKAE